MMRKSINHLSTIIFVSAIAAFFPYLASQFFDSSQNHGILSADVFFLLLLFSLPEGKILYKLPVAVAAGVYAIASNEIDAYAIMGAISLAVFAAACMPRKRKTMLPVYAVFSLFFLIADAGNFFYSTFVLTLRDVWGLVKFYWWGPFVFFTVPLIILSFQILFARKVLWGEKRIEISHLSFFIIIIISSFFNFGVNKLQDRQPIMDFAAKKWLWQVCTPGIIGKNTYLQEDIKTIFPVWKNDNAKIFDYAKPTVVILMESYGVNKSIPYTKALFSAFAEMSTNFSGLYARQASHTQGAEWEDFGTFGGKISGTPLPEKFKRNGMQTWFIHGYEGKFYDRRENYHKFGFDSLLFKEEFLKRDTPLCHYGFDGICDSSVVSFIDSLISDSLPKFIYWTTLDAHPPYELANLQNKSISCTTLLLSNVDCTYLTLQENTSKHIAELASKHLDYRFVIRGDHRPMGSLDQSDFVQSFYFRWVPLIILNSF